MLGPESSQVDVFKEIAPTVEAFLKEGKSGRVFTFGSTASGKTYSMIGSSDEQSGIIPRVLDRIFESYEEVIFSIKELKGKTLSDLLSDTKICSAFERLLTKARDNKKSQGT